MIEQVEAKYNIKLPRKVITIDYDESIGDLYIRFISADMTEGEPTDDGEVIFHYNKAGKIAAVEVMDITAL